jgi:hypothetical protein
VDGAEVACTGAPPQSAPTGSFESSCVPGVAVQAAMANTTAATPSLIHSQTPTRMTLPRPPPACQEYDPKPYGARTSAHAADRKGGKAAQRRTANRRCLRPIRAREPQHFAASTRSWHPCLPAGRVTARRTESSPFPLAGPGAGRCGPDVQDPADPTAQMRSCSPPWPMVAQSAASTLEKDVHGFPLHAAGNHARESAVSFTRRRDARAASAVTSL